MKRRSFLKTIGAAVVACVFPHKAEAKANVTALGPYYSRNHIYINGEAQAPWTYWFFYNHPVTIEESEAISHDLLALNGMSFGDTCMDNCVLHAVPYEHSEVGIRITTNHPLNKGLIVVYIDDGAGRIVELRPGQPARLLPDDQQLPLGELLKATYIRTLSRYPKRGPGWEDMIKANERKDNVGD